MRKDLSRFGELIVVFLLLVLESTVCAKYRWLNAFGTVGRQNFGVETPVEAICFLLRSFHDSLVGVCMLENLWHRTCGNI